MGPNVERVGFVLITYNGILNPEYEHDCEEPARHDNNCTI